MWQRFTPSARRVIVLGQQEAIEMKSEQVGTGHLFLGLMGEFDGSAFQILQQMGLSLHKVRQEIEKEVHPAAKPVSGEPKLSPKAKIVLEKAAGEARRRGRLRLTPAIYCWLFCNEKTIR